LARPEFLHVSPGMVFAGLYTEFEEARYVVFGAPFDGASTYRPGQRFAPNAIRAATANLETVSVRHGVDMEDVGVNDLGDIHATSDGAEMVNRVREVVSGIVGSGKMPVLLGGEHTVSIGAVQGSGCTSLLVFDAHLDLRAEYLGVKLNHASWLRRLIEPGNVERVMVIGVRAFCKEELEYAEGRVQYLTPLDVRGEGRERLASWLRGSRPIYLSFDMDVFDPAYAPGVGNPEPDGLTTSEVFSLLEMLRDTEVRGFDIVEVSPPYDNGVTAVLAGKTAFELIALCEKRGSEAGRR